MNTVSAKWGPIAVSVLVLVIFAIVFASVALKYFDNTDSIKDLLVGMFAQVQAVISYWLGSSAGSKAKDQVIADQAKGQLQ